MRELFEKNRIKIFHSVCDKTLRNEICCGLTTMEKENIMEEIDTVIGNVKDDKNKEIVELVEEELIGAFIGEVVQLNDRNFLEDIVVNAQGASNIDFFDDYTEDGFVGTQGHKITDEIERVLKTFNSKRLFVLAPPLELSILQSISSSKFGPNIENGFKGPNNSMLVGKFTDIDGLNDVPVYSYIPAYEVGRNITPKYLIGAYYDNKITLHKLIVSNLKIM